MRNKPHNVQVRAHSFPENSNAVISRRGFVFGALGVAAAAAVGGGVFAATQCSRNDTPSDGAATSSGAASADASGLSPISVSQDAVFTNEDCTSMENRDEAVRMVAQARLPYGTILTADDDSVAACLLPCETSTPLTKVGLLSFDTGQMTCVLEGAVGGNDGFEIYDVRANTQGVVWTECDILSGTWRVYSAALSGGSGAPAIGTPALAAEGNAEWDTPSLTVSGDYAFWQVCPAKDGPRKKEPSTLMRVTFGAGEDDAKAVIESNGRMACAPSSTPTGVALAPRADIKGTSYQLTHIDASSGEITDAMLLPASMKPTYVAYGDTGFSFAFEDIYNYGDGIANLGTYTSTAAGGAPDGSGEWFRFSRTPLTEPAWCGTWFIVKSTSVVAGVDMAGRRLFSISPENATQGYGEFLASSGSGKRFATYSNIDYTPLSGNKITECNVRIWQAV